MDVNWTYCDDHFATYTNIKSFCYKPETNIQRTANIGLQLWVHKTHSILVLLLIIALFSIRTVTLLLLTPVVIWQLYLNKKKKGLPEESCWKWVIGATKGKVQHHPGLKVSTFRTSSLPQPFRILQPTFSLSPSPFFFFSLPVLDFV